MSLIVGGGTLEETLAHQKLMNGSRYVPEMPDIFKEVSDANRVYIFNVGPWSHKRELGSAGIYFIKPCPEGKQFSEALVLNGVEEEPYPINETTCAMIPKAGKARQLSGGAPGMMLAEQIIGVGPHVAPASSLIPFGVFATMNAKPSGDEIKKANRALNDKYAELVRVASEAHAKGPNAFAEVFDTDFHLRAARHLNKSVAECPWMANLQAPGARENCPGCGTVYNLGVMKCRECGYILDLERYESAKKAGLFAA